MVTLTPVAFCLAISIAPATQGPATQGLATQGPRDQGPRDQGPEATYYFLLARYLEGSGKIDDAVAALRQAMALDPRSAEPRAELAGLYARQDKAAEALTAAEDALTVDPKNQEANRILGSVLAAAALEEQHPAVRPGDQVAAYAKRAMTALEIARGDGTG